MAGAYMEPMLDMMQAIIERTEAQSVGILTLVNDRAREQGEVRNMLEKAEALGALPAWMIEHGKRATGADQ
jgi:hypothetical protein